MFKSKIFQAVVILGLACNVAADDLEIFSGATITSSAPAELLFAIDTSSSMGCGVKIMSLVLLISLCSL